MCAAWDNPAYQESEEPIPEEQSFLDEYIPLQRRTLVYRQYAYMQLNYKGAKDKNDVSPEALGLDTYFADHPYKQEEFMEAFHAYHEAMSGEDEARKEECEKRFYDLVLEIDKHRLREELENFAGLDVSGEQTGFVEIMGEVINRHLHETMSRLGFWTSWKYKDKLS